ncbi:uncharacterized protein LOC135383008 [Ornithodoros turicata]|uniref:uncharacterized protein LOC135383008 n=1 Tax=Ornithodoros turicata TaxID=34597 RepID=UPI003139E2FA
MFIVARFSLMELLKVCTVCSSSPTNVQLTTMGTLARATITCENGHRNQWAILQCARQSFSLVASSPSHCACSTSWALLIYIGVSTSSTRSALYFQQYKMFKELAGTSQDSPDQSQVWDKERAAVLEKLGDRPLHLAGDARCDSPGHTALHGTYTIMETTINRIVQFEVVKATTVSASYCMEQRGLELCLDYFTAKGLVVGTLVTDRHSQVKTFLKDKHPSTSHRFDVWHVAKGIKKKVAAASQSKKHRVLRLWCESIIRHLYWCARTSDSGDLMLAKWTTIMRHVINIHTHPNSLHPET